jgi:lactate dehydrogenase-like 2-hydroxyacid dehydrogenase
MIVYIEKELAGKISYNEIIKSYDLIVCMCNYTGHNHHNINSK